MKTVEFSKFSILFIADSLMEHTLGKKTPLGLFSWRIYRMKKKVEQIEILAKHKKNKKDTFFLI